MSRVRTAATVLVAVAVLLAAGCSSDKQQATTTSQPALVFNGGSKTPTGINRICGAYAIKSIKKVVGGGKYFRILLPTPIGNKGDAVTGQSCSWERRSPGNKVRGLQVEARDYGSDTGSLVTQMTQLEAATKGAVAVPNLGDHAFSATTSSSTLLDVRQGKYFVTVSSHGEGGLDPLPVGTLQLLAASALAKLK